MPESIARPRAAADLPTFETIRRRAHALLGDAQDELRSDWAPGTGPTPAQRDELAAARQAIAVAKSCLDRAAAAGQR